MFSVDGLEWDVPCKIERTAEMKSSEISGMLLNKQYFNDVLGTWMKYDVSIAVPRGRTKDYVDIYNALTEPRDGHAFIFPYNETTLAVTGRVQNVRDTHYLIKTKGGNAHYWAGIEFSVTANHPTKTMALDEVLTVGLAPLPSDSGAIIGDLYEYTASGWERRYYMDADEIYY